MFGQDTFQFLYNFIPQFEQKLDPLVFVPQFGQKLGLLPEFCGCDTGCDVGCE